MMYHGKAKRVFTTSDPDLAVVEYTNQATAFNGEKKADIDGKGALNNEISCRIMTLLAEQGIETHLVRQLDEHSQLVRLVEIIPLEVIVRNIAAGSLSTRLGLAEGTQLPETVVEFSYKRDDLGDPLINRSHARALGIADDAAMDAITASALEVNRVLSQLLREAGILLVDFKLEYGRTRAGDIILADEVSPDTCRFWDAATGDKLDKDRFRRDLGGLREAYAELLARLPQTSEVTV
jgi:phosphoribosylaminoimidazole-succinocarboxamide synthase